MTKKLESPRTKLTLACVTLAIALSFSAPAPAAMVSYEFEGSMEGWVNVLYATGGPKNFAYNPDSLWTAHGGSGFATPIDHTNRDGSHTPLLLRSPQFTLDDSGDLSVWLLGGDGDRGGSPPFPPSNFSDIPAASVATNATVESGGAFMGIGLRRVSDNAYVLVGNRPNDSTSTWQQVSFDATTQLLPLINDNPGEVYTLDLIDYAHSSFGTVAMDDVSIPVGAFVPHNSLLEGNGMWNLLQRHSIGPVDTLADADALLALPGGDPGIVSETSTTVEVFNFHDSSSSGHFPDDPQFPDGGGLDHAVKLTGKINLLEGGDVTFGMTINDGGRLLVDGVEVLTNETLNPVEDVLGTINLAAGVHDVEFKYFQANSSATGELWVATTLGTYTSFSDTPFELLRASAIPEPSSALLLALGAAAAIGLRRKRTS